MKKSNIYTCTGDQGTTSLVGGMRVSKDSLRLHAYGTIDELNSHIGLLIAYITPNTPNETVAVVQKVQHKLFCLGAYLATANATTIDGISDDDISVIESAIDRLDSELPPLKAFVIPGGSRSAAQCHVCRTVARRAERLLVSLHNKQPICRLAIKYINRLSDFFFVLARYDNFTKNIPEIFWQKD